MIERVREELQKPHEKISQLNFTVYFKSSRNDFTINRYKFKEHKDIEVTPYEFNIHEDNIAHRDGELRKIQLKGFTAEKDKLVVLAERGLKEPGQSENSVDYYINEYNGAWSATKLSFGPQEKINKILLNDTIYILKTTQHGQYLCTFDGKIRELTKNPKNLTNIIKYEKSVVGVTEDEIYLYDRGWKSIGRPVKPLDHLISLDDNIIYFHARNDSFDARPEEFIAQDIKTNAFSVMLAQEYGLCQFSDREGIQIWKLLNNSIECINYKSREDLFKNEGKSTIYINTSLIDSNIWAVQRDVAVLSSKVYIKSSTTAFAANAFDFNILLRYDQRINKISIDSINDHKPVGGILT